ncbi:unnamed protein product [Penicillium camemberti]|uniref:Str. FM013 n=1 Tax=Penicillium camemberti (strain FM 013) TaxID=1429867 RepID=A0A0G4NYG4_PENC3|nr:unnamed protein product [Penicillium camemberti]
MVATHEKANSVLDSGRVRCGVRSIAAMLISHLRDT